MRIGLSRVVLLAMAFAIVWAEPLSAEEPSAKQIAEKEIEALIRQLGDRDTAQRDAAARRLIEIGPAAKTQLEAASENDRELNVIRRKAKVLLLSIVRREQTDCRHAFIEGKSADGPSGWKKFRQAVGDTPEARKLYIEIFRAEPKLLKIYAKDPVKAASLVESLCVARKSEEPEVPIRSLVAYLLVAGDRKANHSGQAAKGLANMLALDGRWLVRRFFGGSTPPFLLALEDSCSNKPLLRKLVGRWICNTKFEGDTTWILIVLAELDFKEGLPIALDELKKTNTPEVLELDPWAIGRVLYVIGKLGDATHVKNLEPLLKNSRVLKEHELNGKRVDTQVRDVALLALVQLTGQKNKDYDIKNPGNKFELISLVSVPYIFASDKHREQALAKWREWRKEHPTRSPELIYIASEFQASPDKPSRRNSPTTGFVSTN